jgi:hypothetical protein
MSRFLGIVCALSLVAAPLTAEAKPRKARAAKTVKKKKGKAPKAAKQASEQTKKAIGELAGRYKWGMTSKQVIDIIAAGIKKTYAEKMKKNSSPLDQDRLRVEMNGEITKLRDSLLKFTGQKSSWDISIIDKEFAHNNDESMLVYWEPNQRRFLFFYQDKLWKQFIALNAELFRGKTFSQFADMVAARYGEPKRVTTKDGRGQEVLDHLEWPPAGDFLLKAVDHTNLYGNYCLILVQKSVLDTITARRAENNPKHAHRSGIDQVMRAKGGDNRDGNADVVDQITGKQSRKPPVESDDDAPPQPEKGKGKKR